jgi:hypothetical protein
MDYKALVQQGLLNLGFSPGATSGIMANAYHESGADYSPTRLQGGGEAGEVNVDGKTGYGLFQWTSPDRQQGLADFAKQNGTSSSDVLTQLAFMKKELGQEGFNKINSMGPEDAALYFNDNYERPKYNEENRMARKNMATTIANTIGQDGGKTIIDSVDGIKTNMVTENPNEKFDMEGVMAIIQQPKRNVAAAGEEALREQLVRQAHHKARGAFASRFYEDSDKAMMNAAVAKAQEEAKLQNANAQLTGAGKLAQMIANSQNNSNRQAYASLGAMVGMNVNPMQTQLMSHNELAKMGLQVQLQRKQLEEQMQRQKEMMMVSAMLHPRGGGSGRGGGGGRGSSGEKRIMNPAQNTKYVDEIRNGFREVLENNANLDGFSQHDVDNLNEQAMLSLQKLAVAEDDPYAVQTVNDIKRWQAEQLKHMADSQSGHDLKYD